MEKKEYPFISLIMPIYNSEEYLQENLHSILNQEYKNMEIILVDDGSTDRSAEIMDEFRSNYHNIKCLYQENKGAPAARNAGLNIAKGEFIIFVDSDDKLANNALKRLAEKAIVEKSDLVVGQYDTMDESGNYLPPPNQNFPRKDSVNPQLEREQLFFVPPLPGNKLYRSSVIKENKLKFEQLKRAQDLNFYLKFLIYAEKITFIEYIVYHYRIRSGSISHTVSPVILETIKSIDDVEKHYKKLGKHDKNLFDSLKFKYYTDQLSKTPQINDKKVRKETYQQLKKELKKIDFKTLLPSISPKKKKVTTFKLMFKFLYTSKFYRILQNKKLRK